MYCSKTVLLIMLLLAYCCTVV